jgi:hypothetical protein
LKRHLWWVGVPFVFFAAVKAEDDLSFVLNWTVKGAIVFIGIVLILPSFRKRLLQRPARVLRSSSRPQIAGVRP